MTKVKTTCRLCLVRCGMVVTKDQNRAKSRKSSATAVILSRRAICASRVTPRSISHNSPKRIVHPMKRVGERGSGRWEKVSWDDALDDIAERLKTIIDTHGARAVAVQALPPKEYFAYDMFCDVIGSPTFFKHDSHQCFTPQLMADVLTFGNLLTYPGYNDVDGLRRHHAVGHEPARDQRLQARTRQGRAEERRTHHRRRSAPRAAGHGSRSLAAHPPRHRLRIGARLDQRNHRQRVVRGKISFPNGRSASTT